MQSSDRRDEAIGWHIRLSGSGARTEDWAAFNDWLDVDIANAEAYDTVALEDARLSDVIERGGVLNDNETVQSRWHQRRGLMAIAAGIALAIFAIPSFLSNRGPEIIQTQPGETREIALSDGSTIALNGGTRIALDQSSERFARLEVGEALFTIRHDPARPFIVEASGAVLKDVGTAFNVREAGGALDVAVSQGAVSYNPEGEALTIMAGSQLSRTTPGAMPVINPVPRAAVAGWRQGKLTYQNATLGEIAVDLSRMLGSPVRVLPALAARRFTGIIRVDADRALFFRRLEALLGVHASHNEAGWELSS
jgi:transmembrane sensor